MWVSDWHLYEIRTVCFCSFTIFSALLKILPQAFLSTVIIFSSSTTHSLLPLSPLHCLPTSSWSSSWRKDCLFTSSSEVNPFNRSIFLCDSITQFQYWSPNMPPQWERYQLWTLINNYTPKIPTFFNIQTFSFFCNKHNAE